MWLEIWLVRFAEGDVSRIQCLVPDECVIEPFLHPLCVHLIRQLQVGKAGKGAAEGGGTRHILWRVPATNQAEWLIGKQVVVEGIGVRLVEAVHGEKGSGQRCPILRESANLMESTGGDQFCDPQEIQDRDQFLQGGREGKPGLL